MVDELVEMAGRLWQGQKMCRDCAQPIINYLHEYGMLEKAGMAHLQPEAELTSAEEGLQIGKEI